ncbi:hypothetical protein MBCUT_08900 [Methanobrevibacter cuticularis]|uniref:Uncharacterized protein n=1 Tax=Methanobrevibacter cuticularis TaxID=47311 RepID=A0A166E6P6_9EURY|nr:hypothetical protein [Methanobrevibacter cuticularis]KZX16338.1 hypothetical protein MBCUT_08900 [Methanobrevibacter cuticularis]
MDDCAIKEEELQMLFEIGHWVFGYYYESVEFTSDKDLAHVVKKLFEKKKISLKKPRIRPDFVVLPDSSIGFYSLKEHDSGDGPSEIERLLIIELKRPGIKIKIKERNQAEMYATELLNSKHITEKTKVDVYILGSEVEIRGFPLDGTNINIKPMQYHKILANAEKRLLNLRKLIKKTKGISDEITDPDIKEVVSQKSLNID